MNRNPNTAGITKYWVKGSDDRGLLMKSCGCSAEATDRFLDGLWRLLTRRRRTKFVGVGVFEWRPWRNRLPSGRMVETWRLAFRPSRYAKRYGGEGR